MGWLRKSDSLAHLPVVILTASGQSEDQERAGALGVEGYFVKPTPNANLVKVVLEIAGLWNLKTGPGIGKRTGICPALLQGWRLVPNRVPGARRSAGVARGPEPLLISTCDPGGVLQSLTAGRKVKTVKSICCALDREVRKVDAGIWQYLNIVFLG